ncbi:blue light sensor protein [Erythrobacter arachoides]|uniref:Blue light sensor protein n=1 Tax=Aurantiacibacter arachoides TaxID=1850444 RepID=A0A845A4Q5_9SPHN|nr:BLUF domain-containing protein [Aurantiacibacter arachoides]MXO93907.1 blue light sensor protein [Aurantiacibacter arachoides]GGD45703.1 hypothetical protein GCM10011411_01650 [Aurantiacibacter arachoides]
MGLQSLLYISESTIEPCNAQGEVERILATAHTFNASVGVTGALVFTGTHFAQVVEGEETVVSELIASIGRDERHTKLEIVIQDPLTARRFPDWSMAYNGPSQFVSRHVMRLLNDPSRSESSRAASWLAELLEQFSGFNGGAHKR